MAFLWWLQAQVIMIAEKSKLASVIFDHAGMVVQSPRVATITAFMV
jgi:hypothetical protein